jgi:hypothetical protein
VLCEEKGNLLGTAPPIDFLIALFAHNSHIGILSFLLLRLVLMQCTAVAVVASPTQSPPLVRVPFQGRVHS